MTPGERTIALHSLNCIRSRIALKERVNENIFVRLV